MNRNSLQLRKLSQTLPLNITVATSALAD